MKNIHVPLAVIRGENVPFSVSEALFKARAMEKGWKPHRPSWPDYLVETPEGVIAVEVKSYSDTVSEEQRRTFTILESIGIKVYLWRNAKDAPNKLIRWNGGEAEIKVGLRAA